mmetsp:Transcript_10024/g.34929  ORF Transcript_10024/g.34929 Transcript_10024/m.34929 type:complete len:981 (+) Transcript_10024:142-3084(+)
MLSKIWDTREKAYALFSGQAMVASEAANLACEKIKTAQHKTTVKFRDVHSSLLRNWREHSLPSDSEAAIGSLGEFKHHVLTVDKFSAVERPSVPFTKEQASVYVLTSLDECFQATDFNAALVALQYDAESREEATAQEKTAHLSKTLDALHAALSHHILSHYTEFVVGMNQVADVIKAVNLSSTHVKCSRAELHRAKHDINSALQIAQIQSCRRSLISLQQLLQKIRDVQYLKLCMCKCTKAKKYVQASCAYVNAKVYIEQLSCIQFTKSINEQLLQQLLELETQMDCDLKESWVNFDSLNENQPASNEYLEIFWAYCVLNASGKLLNMKVEETLTAALELQIRSVFQNLATSSTVSIGTKLSSANAIHAELGSLDPQLYFSGLGKILDAVTGLMRTNHIILRTCSTVDSSMNMSPVLENSMLEHNQIDFQQKIMEALGRCPMSLWMTANRHVIVLLQRSIPMDCAKLSHIMYRLAHYINLGECFCSQPALEMRKACCEAMKRWFQAYHEQNLVSLQSVIHKDSWDTTTSNANVRLCSTLAALRSQLVTFPQTCPLETQSSEPSSKLWIDKIDKFVSLCSVNYHTMQNKYKPRGDDSVLHESSAPFENSLEPTDRNEGDTSVFTASTFGLLQVVTEYLQIMSEFPSYYRIHIFTGVCALFESALCGMFQIFGDQNSLCTTTLNMSPRLRHTLQRLLEQAKGNEYNRILDKQRLDKSKGGNGGHLASLTSSGNLFALKERCIAMEALRCTACQFVGLKQAFKAVLCIEGIQQAERWFSQTLGVVEDLREHVYREVVRLLIQFDWVPEAIGDSEKMTEKLSRGKYNIKTLDTDHNVWVEKLLSDLRQYSAKLSCATIDEASRQTLWEYTVETVSECIISGFARVKKCTNEGRASMSLDFQVLMSGMRTLAPAQSKLEQHARRVDTYIKAFYLPESDVGYWIQAHPEFSKSHILGLIAQMTDTHGWKSSKRKEMQLLIEECHI